MKSVKITKTKKQKTKPWHLRSISNSNSQEILSLCRLCWMEILQHNPTLCRVCPSVETHQVPAEGKHIRRNVYKKAEQIPNSSRSTSGWQTRAYIGQCVWQLPLPSWAQSIGPVLTAILRHDHSQKEKPQYQGLHCHSARGGGKNKPSFCR